MPWLLARVTASTPADFRALKAPSAARKVYCLGAGVPRRVTAVSRFTTARSAFARTLPAGPQVCVRARADAPSKCTSPAKASVAVLRRPSRELPGSAARGAVTAVRCGDAVAVRAETSMGARAPWPLEAQALTDHANRDNNSQG